jgi:hypothetical protein
MNDYELIQIENAFEDAADLMQEQDLSLTETLEEVAFIHDLDDDQIKELRRMLINLS